MTRREYYSCAKLLALYRETRRFVCTRELQFIIIFDAYWNGLELDKLTVDVVLLDNAVSSSEKLAKILSMVRKTVSTRRDI